MRGASSSPRNIFDQERSRRKPSVPTLPGPIPFGGRSRGQPATRGRSKRNSLSQGRGPSGGDGGGTGGPCRIGGDTGQRAWGFHVAYKPRSECTVGVLQ